MAQFADITITRSGLDMIAKSQTGDKLIFTGIKIGDGQIGDQSIPDLTDIINYKKDVPINSVTAKENGHAEIIGIIDNEEVDVGFFVREIGIYAKINDGGTPALYGYANAGNLASYLADKSIPMDAIKFKIDIVIGNAENVSFTSDKSIVYVTQENLDAHNTDADAHQNLVRVMDIAADEAGAEYTLNDGSKHNIDLWQGMAQVLNDTALPEEEKATLMMLMNGLAHQIKAITGKDSWKDEPGVSLVNIVLNYLTSVTGTDATLTIIKGDGSKSTVTINNVANAKACSGNAATSTKLQTARNINGVAFDGTKDITIAAGVTDGNVSNANAWWVKLGGKVNLIIQGGECK